MADYTAWQNSTMIHLRSEGVSVVLAINETGLPVPVYWGRDLGPLSESDTYSLSASLASSRHNAPAPPVTLLPSNHDGWQGRPGVSGSRSGADWSPRFRSRAVFVDGHEVTGFVEGGQASVLVEASDASAKLDLSVTIELCAGGVLRTKAALRNSGADGYEVRDVNLVFRVPEAARELLDLSGHWGNERVPQRSVLTVGSYLRESRHGRPGFDSPMILHLGTPGFGFRAGEIWSIHVGWSGNSTYYAERVSSGEQVLGGGELLMPGEVILDHGETYVSPWVYGVFGEGLDGVAGRFHAHIRARDHHVDSSRPVTLNVWEAVYFNHDAERLIDLAERAAAMGVERFVLDDGWFGARRNSTAGLGDWTVSSEVWPDGLGPLIDRVHALGMQFGLWFEPEMVNPDSNLARSRPEWIMQVPGRLPPEARNQQVLNIGNAEAYAAIRDQIVALLDEYPIDYIKWDHNRELVDAGDSSRGGKPAIRAQTLAFYALVDELKAFQPALEIESCASGGARIDLGVLERTDRVWNSDCIDPLERQRINRWTNQLLPLELMGSHIASARSHTTGRTHDLSFRAATALFGHLGLEWDLASASAEEIRDATEWIEFYKTVREDLFQGHLVRSDFPDESVQATGVVRNDLSAAIFQITVLNTSEVSSRGRLPIPGLDPARRYSVSVVEIGDKLRMSPTPGWVPSGDDDGVPSTELAFTGSMLEAGLLVPGLDPEHAVVLRIQEI